MDKRDRYLRKTYSITSKEYEEILEYQGGLCYICSRPPSKMRLAVDHDHKTGLVRGLLCWRCNNLIARAGDNPTTLWKASVYLQTPPAVQALGREAIGLKGGVRRRRRNHRQSQAVVEE